jgi:two-component system chemotaxis response regulator CheY
LIRETLKSDAVHAQSSGNMGCDRSVVLRGVLENRQRSIVPAPGIAMNLDGSRIAQNIAKSGGYTAQVPSRGMARVFVVDDEDFIRDLYREVFEANGITVFAASNGEECLDLFKTLKHRPDAIIMDHRMPGKDGIETTREILKIDPRVPIIFSSADESVREQALEAGAISFWAKPFPVSLLLNAMLDIVKARRRDQ